MINMHKHSKYAVIILIFILSILTGLKVSNLIYTLEGPQPLNGNKQMREVFDNLKYNRKLVMEYQSKDIISLRSKIMELANLSAAVQINSEASENSYVVLLEVKNESFKEFYNSLLQMEGFYQEQFYNDAPEYDINIEEHISNKELAKMQLQNLLKHSVIPERVDQYNDQLENIQAEIDSLHNMKIQYSKFKNNTLISIESFKNINATKLLLSALKKFGIYTSITLILLVGFFIILFFILDNLLKLMKAVGIKTTGRSSSAYYYSPRKKKIKRKYKDEEEEK